MTVPQSQSQLQSQVSHGLNDWPISQLPGLTSQNQQRLQKYGIETTAQLLKQGRTQAQKMILANLLKVNLRDISKWAAMAELSQVPSVGCRYCGLLLHAGVGSTTQLAQMPVHRLHQQVLRLHAATLRRRDLCPSIAQVQQWIQQAGEL
ncbi:MAG: DUF4332 domain-containing protein [Microcoleaceae cyanobacterium]